MKKPPAMNIKRVLVTALIIRVVIGVIALLVIIGNKQFAKEMNTVNPNMTNATTESEMERKELTQDGYSVFYYASGSKGNELIVFLHPAFADHRTFNKQIDYFGADSLQLILYP